MLDSPVALGLTWAVAYSRSCYLRFVAEACQNPKTAAPALAARILIGGLCGACLSISGLIAALGAWFGAIGA